jgi:hypothetical protein
MKHNQHQGVFPNIAADLEHELIYALKCFALVTHDQISDNERELAKNIVDRLGSVLGHGNANDQHGQYHTKSYPQHREVASSTSMRPPPSLSHQIPNLSTIHMPSNVFSLGHHQSPSLQQPESVSHFHHQQQHSGSSGYSLPTFILTDRSGRRFTVPYDFSGGRAFNDCRIWCYRRGRFCYPGEMPDSSYSWTQELQNAYEAVLRRRKPSYNHHSQQQASSFVQTEATNLSSSAQNT